MLSPWTRREDGSYERDGWVIRRRRVAGTGQARPFERVSVKVRTGWGVYTPEGVFRAEGGTLAGAKRNADRQIEFAKTRGWN